MLPERGGRPTATNGDPAQSISVATKNEFSVAPATYLLAELDTLAAHVDGAFVVVVKVNGARYRRRCFLTAAAAQNAARKAVERGENANVYMAELKPLWLLVGGGL